MAPRWEGVRVGGVGKPLVDGGRFLNREGRARLMDTERHGTKTGKKGDILCQNLQRGRGLSDGHGKAWFKDWREKKKVIICARIFGEGGDSVSDGQGQIGSEDCKRNAAGGAVHEP